MKKEWLGPELKELNLKETNELLECETAEEVEGIGENYFIHRHICPRCGYNFGHGIGSHMRWEHHVAFAKCGADADRVPVIPVS
ncbi:hypothetical protein [Clostridium sp. D53t1_180928_C8]|uniref:hypothetical protein n=1 Tax=Clostridium sp. D53t1_180928_C8 TaxID=2787101 RepID=UPI0018AB82D0|nr:hypothetical protein [Clostridium sp. D53t1_180928_C8]